MARATTESPYRSLRAAFLKHGIKGETFIKVLREEAKNVYASFSDEKLVLLMNFYQAKDKELPVDLCEVLTKRGLL